MARRLIQLARAKLPEYDLAVPAPNSHQLPDRPPLETDGTVRFLLKGEPVYFVQVEVQKNYSLNKYATMRAYHGSEVSKIKIGGHMISISPKAAEALKFRQSEIAHGEEYSYHGAYLCRDDLDPMAEDGEPFEDRAFAAGMTDFGKGIRDPEPARAMLREMSEKDQTLANLFFRTILEEVPDVSMVEDVLQPDMLEKLRGLKAFRDYEARVEASAQAKAQASAQASADAKVKAALAELEAERSRTEVRAKADDLAQFFTVRGDKPSMYAYSQMYGCEDAARLRAWLDRAYRGETAAEIFPEP